MTHKDIPDKTQTPDKNSNNEELFNDAFTVIIIGDRGRRVVWRVSREDGREVHRSYVRKKGKAGNGRGDEK